VILSREQALLNFYNERSTQFDFNIPNNEERLIGYFMRDNKPVYRGKLGGFYTYYPSGGKKYMGSSQLRNMRIVN